MILKNKPIITFIRTKDFFKGNGKYWISEKLINKIIVSQDKRWNIVNGKWVKFTNSFH